ncbi:DSBA oxidoreductase [Methylocella silvestris BL2]|uniref:DSBA oxidoreductase n=1 Tax=Methylocella silvestris (strain DSM 15510 / CIP 108128 / LMG 27833 / NCIMB 13906 / BL2) TaxID=395965 RepID=B8EMM8_METSB|nr:DsbA family oxidoreductase [Methylocella silvestris]ACK52707.1 DSBA oxidoreductase [Methylocella silvestris BL2]
MSAKQSEPIPVDFIGDLASARCFIGLRLIQTVVASVPGLEVDIRWHPFQIDPGLPPEGQDRGAYLVERWGSPQKAREALQDMEEQGREFGLRFAFDKIRRQPNTFEAHRLIRYARSFGVELQLVESIFRAFFMGGVDIGDREALLLLAAHSGVDPELAAPFLGMNDDVAGLRQELSGFRSLGMDRAPRFIIAGKETIHGLVPAEDFADALFRAVQEE